MLSDIANENDLIKLIDGSEETFVVLGRYFEGGIEDNGIVIEYLDGEELCVYDGDYTVFKRA